MKAIWLLVLTPLFLVGCSKAGTIQPTSGSESEFDDAVYDGERTVINEPTPGLESHRIFHQASTGFVSVESIRESAERRVNDFCDRENKNVRVLAETTSKPPHILGNFPRIEIEFECVGGSVSQSEWSKYDEIAKLKGLLDSGAITEAEYETEKAKVLNSD